MTWAWMQAREWGWRGVIISWLVVLTAFLVLVTVGLPEANVDVTPTKSDAPIVATTGDEGFPVELFCDDPLTKVDELPAPDASGVSYQLLRVRDGRSELVLWTSGPTNDSRIATHFFYVGGEQKKESAFVTDGARACIEKKKR